MSFDSLEAVARRLVRGRGRARRPRRAVAASDRRRPSATGSARSGLPLQSLDAGERRRPRVHAVLRRRADGTPLLREGARRRPAQRRPPVPRCTGRSSATTSATSGRSRRCGEPWSTRRSSRWPPATSASPRRGRAPSPPPSRTRFVLAYEAVDGKSLDGVPPGGDHRRRARRHLATARRTARAAASPTATSASPTSSSAATARSG